MNKRDKDHIMDAWIDGVLKKGESQIRLELEDYWKMMDVYSKVLDRVTKGKMSKPNYTWDAISEVLDEVEMEDA